MVWSGLAGEIALGKVEDSDGRVSEAYTGPQVAWGMARGRVGLVRRQDPQRLVDVDGAQRHLLPRARRPAPHSLVAHGRPAGAALVRLLAALLQPRPHLHERVPRGAAARLPRRPHLVDRLPRPRRQPGALVARLAARGACRLPRRPADRPQLRDAARRDRRRSRRRHRRRPDPRPPGAVRPHAGHRGPRLRPGRLRRSDPRPHPDERPLRIRQRSRRHVRAGRLPRVRPRRARSLGWSGKWDSLPAAHATAIAFDLLVVLGLFLVGRRFGGTAARDRARLRLDRVSLHRLRDERQLERHDHARDPHLGILALDLRRRPGCDDRARRLDEVRLAPSGAALAHVSERPPARAPLRSSRSGSSSRRWPCSRSCCSSRA